MILMDIIWLFSVLTQPFPTTLWLPTTPTLHRYRSARGNGYATKIYLKWQAIQLAVHSIVSTWIDYEQLQNHGKLRTSICNTSDNYNVHF